MAITGSSTQLKVADFSTHLPGPLASAILHATGADVLRIEDPRYGDGNRGEPPHIRGMGNFHVALAGGVRSLAVSTKSPHWDEVAEAVVRWADIAIVAGSPEVLARRKLDFARMSATNPRLVYVLITGFGLDGPWA